MVFPCRSRGAAIANALPASFSVLLRILLFMVWLVWASSFARAQAPDCGPIQIRLTASGTTSATFDNRFAGCVSWTLQYTNDTFGSISLTFQSSPGSTSPTGFVPFAGTVVTGINPNTSTTGAVTTFENGTVAIPYVNVLLIAGGSGTVNGVFYGYKSGASTGPVSSGCPGTTVTPCVVDGPAASGSPPTNAPVLIAGQDGTNTRTFKTDTGGNVNAVGPDAAGAASTTKPVQIAGNDGTDVRAIATDAGGNSTAVGPDAAGAASTTKPVQIAANDGTDVRRVSSNAAGDLIPANASSANADGVSNTNASPTGDAAAVIYNRILSYLFNNSTWERSRDASTSNLTASVNVGAILQEKGPRWSVLSNPSTGSQATASKAAGTGTVQHVADCIQFSAASVAAPALTSLTINLRNGATGAGTILEQFVVTIDAAAGQNVQPFQVCGLNLIGSATTAMTLEFSAALANLTQTVTLTGYDVQ